MKNLLAILSAGIMFLTGCYYDNEEELYPETEQGCGTTASYSKDIEPFINSTCLSCHSSSANSGGVNLEGYDQVRTYALNGKLFGVLSHASGYSPMPKNSSKVSDCNLARIKKWIDDGSINN